MKIAILVLLHRFGVQQQKLISHLSQDFRVYVHVDRKSDIDVDDFTRFRNVRAFKAFRVYWGSYNQIRATLMLFREAFRDQHERYILISGDDLPIKSNSEILEFFENNDFEYLEFSSFPIDDWRNENGGFDRIDYYHPRTRRYGRFLWKDRVFNYLLRRLFVMLRPMYPKRRMKMTYYGGVNWMNLTHSCVSDVLEFVKQNPNFVRHFRFTRCADEIFFHTVVCSQVERERLVNNSLRFVDWKSGPEKPRVLRANDYERIMASDAVFARKFSLDVDEAIINKIYSSVGA